MAVVGLGLDICSIERMRKILEGPRAERFLERVYTDAERALCSARADSAGAYAARFAAKEALVKALGAPPGIRWRDMEVVRAGGAPGFVLTGVAARVMAERRLGALLSLTHDAGVAAATVVLQQLPGEG
jgi:holo-[acyl-carrier protein] synthase